MLPTIQIGEQGHVACFERTFRHPVELVWSFLTGNDKLSQWFPELRVIDLRDGGVIQFDFRNGTVKELQIVAFTAYRVLEFTWWGDSVRFELEPAREGCHLVLKRKIKTMTEHTPKDLAGWHVCVDVIGALLDGKPYGSREQKWTEYYHEYAETISTHFS